MSHRRIGEVVLREFLVSLILAIAMGAGLNAAAAQSDLDKLVGQPADIASSAYQYRADRKPEDNPPESWLALMRYASMPLNKPVDMNAPAIKQVLCALLWEEIRPIQRLELTWAENVKDRPAPEELTVTTLDNQGTASSWWNNLKAVQKTVKPAVSADGRTYAYDLRGDTCGIVIGVGTGKAAASFAVPQMRVLVADTWKKMDVEIEWGYEPKTDGSDYSGRIEAYDGRVGDLAPLDGDAQTTVTAPASWRSVGKGGPRRGVKASLLYMGTSKWRRAMPFTSQPDDVARTIVTVWTKAGNFSFLAADLENGPILAPEYGFFVRRISAPAAATTADGCVGAADAAGGQDERPSPAARNCSAGEATQCPGSAGIPPTNPFPCRASPFRRGVWPCIPGLTAMWPSVGAVRSRAW